MEFLKASNISFSYKDKKVIDSMNCSVKKGSITSVIGPNGSGKSTFLKLAIRALKLRNGTIEIKEKNINDYSIKEFARTVSYLPQSHKTIRGITAEELVLKGRIPYADMFGNLSSEDLAEAKWAMKACGIYGNKDKQLCQMSGGEQKKAWIAMSLARKAEFMILDEPTNNLDIGAVLEISELLKKINSEYKATILMVLHDINLALRYSDYVIVMKDGNVFAQGKCTDIINEKMIQDVYGIKSEIYLRNDIPIFVPIKP